MSAQINLYHPRYLKQRDLLTLRNVLVAALALYGVLAALGGWAWLDAVARREAAAATEAELKTVKGQVEAATKAAALRKASPQLAAEVENAQALLQRRVEIASLLESGTIGSSGGFSDFLRGFARQAPEGLWLTGFSIGAGGNDMEIRGSMLNAAALPDYIRRLGGEKAFQGRSFAALTMNRADPPAPPGSHVGPAVAIPAGQGAAPAAPPLPIDFVLLPKLADATGAKP